MKSTRFNKFLQANIGVIIPVILTALVIVLGAIVMYLAEHKQPGANITNLGDALWWSVETITTVGYGDYTPISTLGRTVAIIVMFAGIGIAVTLVTILSQNRVQRMQERLKSKTEGKTRVLANETKATIKDKVEGIEKLSEEDFNPPPRCGSGYRSKPKYCSDCGFALSLVALLTKFILDTTN